MRKIICLVAFMATPFLAMAEEDNDDKALVAAEAPDTTEVFLSDIIKEQEEVSNRQDMFKHFNDVWSRRSYLNIAYNSTKFTPQEDVPSGLNGLNHKLMEQKSNWGITIQYGRTYRLHKKPIANTLQFGIDYTGIDLSVNHYQMASEGKFAYDSSVNITEKGSGTSKDVTYFYTPWNLEKYEGSYGMTVGPSLTIAPFNYVNVRGLNYMKLHVYFHIGYQISFAYLMNNVEADKNPSGDFRSTMEKNLKLDMGHGLLTNFGLSLTWKMIGIGYEHRVARNKYKTLNSSDFIDDSYKIKTASDLIYLTIRLGR